MNSVEYIKREVTIGYLDINRKALILSIPLTIMLFLPYFIIWDDHISAQIKGLIQMLTQENANVLSFLSITISQSILFIAVLLIGIILHEFIHGIMWSFFIKGGFKSISFGIIWKFLTPYCHSKEPMIVRKYILGAIMPAIVLGIVPVIVSYFTGSLKLWIFGYIFTLAALGDFIMVWVLIKEKSDSLVQDHPTKVGCYIFDKVNNNSELTRPE